MGMIYVEMMGYTAYEARLDAIDAVAEDLEDAGYDSETALELATRYVDGEDVDDRVRAILNS